MGFIQLLSLIQRDLDVDRSLRSILLSHFSVNKVIVQFNRFELIIIFERLGILIRQYHTLMLLEGLASNTGLHINHINELL